MKTLSEAVAGAAAAKGCTNQEAWAEMLRDLGAGRLSAEGIPSETEGGEAWPIRHRFEPISEAYWLSNRVMVNPDKNCLYVDGDDPNIHTGGYEHIRISAPQSKENIEPKNKGGRPPEYDWQPFYAEITRVADLDGLPDKSEELVKRMTDFMERNLGTKNRRTKTRCGIGLRLCIESCAGRSKAGDLRVLCHGLSARPNG